MKVSVQAAESNLSDLIDAALSGEEVVIAKGGEPLVKIVPVARKKFVLGHLEGQIGEAPDFFEPMSEDDLALWEGRT